eukprot:TRINITY_DN72304_c0_g1_i1.p1 TRINITY_DN72304_c0_g1~~TRINITY_DN72304_c0_g1_i1.p1  ORF type:complete len:329 (+),score=39.79 TRINITY_DN72304_c0_g1_i1:49-987(+)
MATATCDDGKAELQLEVCGLSGSFHALSVCSGTSVERVCFSIQSLVGIPARSQVWLVNNEEVPLQQATTLVDTNICDGDRITVVHAGFEPLVPLPDFFELTLTSVRERFGRRYSTAFVIVYKIEANIPEGRMIIEPWRKNDHDRTVYDCKAGIVESMTSHYMCGESTAETPLADDPLSAFAASWAAPCTRVTEDSERFWRWPVVSDSDSDAYEAAPDRGRDDDKPQLYPKRHAVPGWFVAPSEDCTEVMVDLPIVPATRRHIVPATRRQNVSIRRLLLDAEGRPLRAAVQGCKIGCLHEDIEEYDIKLQNLS